ncbi:HAUS augmin-like complex subunit 4 [Mizuhopecten yessoensis]|uniref:HAUS augmin-like complex subunit 4 n=1 Tax=Mizuhopecten yessoensis TaxID=6573 RepID=A0A210QMB4_MIZYE|nr:HAUS augmin-like complex subunit 4 [Mizuhopecten yessoensis]OWF49879.1 HAUS augmin-like complex subunit 4 [Mizuhopecten yessoensis]
MRYVDDDDCLMMDNNSADISDKLNTTLGIDLSAEDVQNQPEFCQLLSVLTNHISNEGVSTLVQKDLLQAEEELKHEKHSWLLQKILYHELEELLRDYDIKSQDTALSTEDRQFHTILQETLTRAEISDYLDCSPDPTSTDTLLGLSKTELSQQNPHRKHLPFIQQKLIPDIEKRLREKCDSLINFHQTGLEEDDVEPAFNPTTQLPALVESDKHQLQKTKAQLKTVKHNKDKQFWQYYKTLIDSLGVLEEVVAKHRFQNQTEQNTVTTEWLVGRCDGLCLKIRLLEMQVLCDTYTKDTVKALHSVRDHLDSNFRETDKEFHHVCQALRSYESVGMGFDELVEEFRKLKEEKDNKQWALTELHRGGDKQGTVAKP